MMFPATTLRNTFSSLRVSVTAAAASSGSECNDTLPRSPASRLDTAIHHNSPGPRIVLNTPEDHLAAALRFGQPTKREGKISPPVTRPGCGRKSDEPQKDGPIVEPKAHQDLDKLRENMREEL
jgi:hypothetical protein